MCRANRIGRARAQNEFCISLGRAPVQFRTTDHNCSLRPKLVPYNRRPARDFSTIGAEIPVGRPFNFGTFQKKKKTPDCWSCACVINIVLTTRSREKERERERRHTQYFYCCVYIYIYLRKPNRLIIELNRSGRTPLVKRSPRRRYRSRIPAHCTTIRCHSSTTKFIHKRVCLRGRFFLLYFTTVLSVSTYIPAIYLTTVY